MLTRICRPV